MRNRMCSFLLIYTLIITALLIFNDVKNITHGNNKSSGYFYSSKVEIDNKVGCQNKSTNRV
ncbi:Uncharacterised protein [Yersinia frederiksenii]|nr:Uncharacterised protein [Yersinia frederiksenii]